MGNIERTPTRNPSLGFQNGGNEYRSQSPSLNFPALRRIDAFVHFPDRSLGLSGSDPIENSKARENISTRILASTRR